MDAINQNSHVINTQTLTAQPLPQATTQTEEATLAEPQDTFSQQSPTAEADDEAPKMGKLKRFIKAGKELVNEAKESPITFIKDHKKSIPGIIAAAAIIATNTLDDEQVDDIKDLATEALTKKSIDGKIQFFTDCAKFVGHSAAVGCLIGGAAVAIEGLVQAGGGLVKIGKATKDKEGYKAATGTRSVVAGTRKAMKGAVISAAGVTGGALASASKVARSVVMPQLRKVAAGLNIGIGVRNIIKGIKEKDKKSIVSGALDIGYGTATMAAVLFGGPVLSAACTGLLVAKQTVAVGKKAARFIKKDREIQEKRRQQEEANKPETVQTAQAQTTQTQESQQSSSHKITPGKVISKVEDIVVKLF
ncbi:hypothetical protein IJT10_08250 [bacterium]|nr:hypothetical protein [bacterium]